MGALHHRPFGPRVPRVELDLELANSAVGNVDQLSGGHFRWQTASMGVHQVLDEHPHESAVTSDENVRVAAAAAAAAAAATCWKTLGYQL